jgi:hypothetical protein
MMNYNEHILQIDENDDDPSLHQSNRWNSIKNKMNPLKEMMKKHKRTEDAFDMIFKSFTYGRKLLRKRITKAQKEA